MSFVEKIRDKEHAPLSISGDKVCELVRVDMYTAHELLRDRLLYLKRCHQTPAVSKAIARLQYACDDLERHCSRLVGDFWLDGHIEVTGDE